MLKGFLTVSGWTMISRVLGLVRDQLLAALLGAGAAQDAYQIACRLPNMFRRLFGEGALNAAFVPLFSSLLEREGKDTAQRFANETMSVLLSWLLLLTVLGEVFMPGVLHVIAPGFTHGDLRDSLAISLSRITFPYLFLICGAALVAGVLNGMHHFGVAAAAYVSFNVVGIASIMLLPRLTGDVAHAAAWGVSASGVIQFAILLYAARRAGMRLQLVAPCVTPRIRTLLGRMGVGLVGSGITQINFMVDTIIATLLPAGSVSLMYFADRVNQLPLGVLGAAAGTTLLPVLTRSLAAGDVAGAHATQNRAISYALILTLPAAAGLLVIAAPVMMALFGHGHFSARDAVLAAQSLRAYAVGLPAFVLVKVLAPGFFARGDTRTPVLVGTATLVLNFILNVSFMRWLAHIGPPLASSLAAMVNAGALAFLLRRRGALVSDPVLGRQLAGMVGCAALMALGLFGMEYTPLGGAMTAGPLMRLVDVGVMIVVGMGLYLAGLHMMGVADMRQVAGAITRRLRR
ncbi:murein biosynthesis integral membrane protein MurJ [Komagataeibacter melaceti]|uniref:Probable lipid II flippase MurJ n=1 Tax=Komagataeibacter melaceti TaxID=2766577 RepID=A0A371YY62_9PROT|nr:murein biosynthesis integral membrane protein MurJ [Komagataeibacter melaceti]RFD19143.1 murein biosynthesis integral membrane protein MurJ [Komagataeibacter melaceti]